MNSSMQTLREAPRIPCPQTRRAIGSAPRRPTGPRRMCTLAASKDDRGKEGAGSSPDNADASKADFSAYWSMRFRNFFSKRRQYLEDAARDKGPPPVVQRLDARIAELREQLARLDAEDRLQRQVLQAQVDAARDAREAAADAAFDAAPGAEQRAAALQRRLDAVLAPLERVLPGWDSAAPPQSPADIARADLDLARGVLHRRRFKVATLGVAQFRAALVALVMSPFTVPAALHARWTALFTSPRYERFLLAEGERIWGWRNRMENERWFWEVLFMDRFLVPLAFHVCYQIVVPSNLLWSVLVPVSFLIWTDGRPPTPANMEFWIIAVAAYIKCWHQVEWFLRLVLQWG